MYVDLNVCAGDGQRAMKKTPKDLATAPAFVAINTIVAASAITGIVSSMTSVAKASESSYDTKLQGSVNPASSPEMATYNTVCTQSYIGFNGQYGNDDSRTTTDQW